MKIETKYDIGQEVWVMLDNKPQCMKIWGVNVNIQEGFDGQYTLPDKTNIEYYNWGKHHIIAEEYLFPTKEELLKSL